MPTLQLAVAENHFAARMRLSETGASVLCVRTRVTLERGSLRTQRNVTTSCTTAMLAGLHDVRS